MYIAVGILLFCGLGQSLGQYEGDSCRGAKGQGVCKYLTQCAPAVQEIQKGSFPQVCSYEGSQVIVCCFGATSSGSTGTTTTTTSTTTTTRTTTKPTTTTTTTQRTITSRLPGDLSKAKCKEYSKYAYEEVKDVTLGGGRKKKPVFSTRLECPFEYEKLIVGGKETKVREFPHMAQVGFGTENEIAWDCAGSIISENFILTAGHCLDSRQNGPPKFVRVGITNQSDTYHVQLRNIIDIIQYPEYAFSKYHDIGLLKLDRNIKLDLFARPACLYTERTLPEEKAIATGWGKVEFAGQGSRDLLKVVLEHFDAAKCNTTYRREINQVDSYIQHGIMDDTMLCYGSKNEFKDTCQGDSGGPIQNIIPDTAEIKCMYWVVGVTSFGKSCGAAKNVPGVYTRVSAYVKWIEDTVWPR